MTNDILIRQAKKSDLPSIIKLYSQPQMDNGATVTLSEATIIFDKVARYPNYHFHVACQSHHPENLLGIFGLLIMDNLGHKGSPSGIVEGVCVGEQSQGQGIGKAMMLEAMSLCRQAKCYKLTLSSNSIREKAHQFYLSLGFRQHGLSFYIDL